jgi:transposase
MLSISNSVRIFLFAQPTDMRKSFNGLSGLVTEHFDAELLSGHLFLFFNRKRDRVKILAWDRDGLAIWYKQLEAGTFQLATISSEQESIEIDSVKLSLLLSGIDLASAKQRKRYKLA